MNNYTQSSQALTVPETLRQGFKLWKVSLKSLILIAFIVTLVGCLPSFFIHEFNTFDMQVTLLKIAELIAYLPILFVVNLTGISMMFCKLHMLIEKKPFGLKNNFIFALMRLPHLIAALLISSICITIGYALFFVPGIMISIYLALYFPIIILHRKGPIVAFQKSIALIKQHWWHTFGVIISVLLLFMVIALFLQNFTTEIFKIELATGGEIWVGHNILRLILGTLFIPFFCSVVLVLFNDLKLRRPLILSD